MPHQPWHIALPKEEQFQDFDYRISGLSPELQRQMRATREEGQAQKTFESGHQAQSIAAGGGPLGQDKIFQAIQQGLTGQDLIDVVNAVNRDPANITEQIIRQRGGMNPNLGMRSYFDPNIFPGVNITEGANLGRDGTYYDPRLINPMLRDDYFNPMGTRGQFQQGPGVVGIEMGKDPRYQSFIKEMQEKLRIGAAFAPEEISRLLEILNIGVNTPQASYDPRYNEDVGMPFGPWDDPNVARLFQNRANMTQTGGGVTYGGGGIGKGLAYPRFGPPRDENGVADSTNGDLPDVGVPPTAEEIYQIYQMFGKSTFVPTIRPTTVGQTQPEPKPPDPSTPISEVLPRREELTNGLGDLGGKEYGQELNRLINEARTTGKRPDMSQLVKLMDGTDIEVQERLLAANLEMDLAVRSGFAETKYVREQEEEVFKFQELKRKTQAEIDAAVDQKTKDELQVTLDAEQTAHDRKMDQLELKQRETETELVTQETKRANLALEQYRASQIAELDRSNRAREIADANELQFKMNQDIRYNQLQRDLEAGRISTADMDREQRRDEAVMADYTNLRQILSTEGIAAANRVHQTNIQTMKDTSAQKERDLEEELALLELDEIKAQRLSDNAHEVNVLKEKEYDREMREHIGQEGIRIQEDVIASKEEIAREERQLERELSAVGVSEAALNRTLELTTASIAQQTQLMTAAMQNPAAFAAMQQMAGGVNPFAAGLEGLGLQMPTTAGAEEQVQGQAALQQFFPGGIPTIGALSQTDPEALEYLSALLGYGGITPGGFGRLAAAVTPRVAGPTIGAFAGMPMRQGLRI